MCILAALGGVFYLSCRPLQNWDIWWQMGDARDILANGRVPRTDFYSFTAPGKPWLDKAWLSGLVLLGIYRAGGVPLLILVKAGVIAGAFALALAAAFRRRPDAAAAALVALAGGYQVMTRSIVRPFIFSYLLFALSFLVVQSCVARGDDPGSGTPRARDYLWGGRGRLALLIPIVALWANLHADFVTAILLVCAYIAGEEGALALRFGRRTLRTALRGAEGARLRALAITVVLLPAASLANPFGWRTLAHPIDLMGSVRFLRQVEEWRRTPLSVQYGVFWALLAFSLIASARAALRAWRGGGGERQEPLSLALGDLIAAAGFGLMGGDAVRNVTWILLIAPAMIASRVRPFEVRADEPAARDRRGLGVATVLGVALALAGWHGLVMRGAGLGMAPRRYPFRALEFMQANGVPGRVFNRYEWGGAIVWAAYPEVRVFIDGRCDLYGDAIFDQYMTVLEGLPGWKDVLARWNVQSLLLSSENRSAAFTHLFEDDLWWPVYWDDVAVVAVRNSPENMALIRSHDRRLTNPITFDNWLVEPHDTAALESELQTVLQSDPGCALAHAMKAEVLRVTGRADEAAREAGEALKLNRKEPWGWRCRGYLALAAGRSAEAERDFRTALACLERDWLSHIGLARALFAEGRKQEARATIDALSKRKFRASSFRQAAEEAAKAVGIEAAR